MPTVYHDGVSFIPQPVPTHMPVKLLFYGSLAKVVGESSMRR